MYGWSMLFQVKDLEVGWQKVVSSQVRMRGRDSSQSWAYMIIARPICLKFDWHVDERARSRAWAKTGNKIAARMAIMAITTSSSISVKPERPGRRHRIATFLPLPSPVKTRKMFNRRERSACSVRLTGWPCQVD